MVAPGRERLRRVCRAAPDPEAVQRVEHEVALAHRVQLARVARPAPRRRSAPWPRRRRRAAPGRHAGRPGTATCSRSSPRAGGITWQWMRNAVPSWSTSPVSIGRVGGNGARPPWRPNPSESSASISERDLVRLRLDAQVHHVLAGQARDGGAADVLHDGARAAPTRSGGRARGRRRPCADPTGGTRTGGARRDGWAGPTSRASVAATLAGTCASATRLRTGTSRATHRAGPAGRTRTAVILEPCCRADPDRTA